MRTFNFVFGGILDPMKKARKGFVLVANWKMNPDSLEEAKKLAAVFERKAKAAKGVVLVICPPAPFIPALAKSAKATHIGAQDVDFREAGAFTGAVSARELMSAGAEYTIVGHSERRAAGDTDEIVGKKVSMALEAGLRVILCVGEKERDSHGRYLDVVRAQIRAAFVPYIIADKKKAPWITIAYEPVWAIGKDYAKALSPAGIHEMSIYIKKVVAEILGKDQGLKTRVLYGGSVNFENAQDIITDGAIDGLLVGRQSLDAEGFSNMISYAGSL